MTGKQKTMAEIMKETEERVKNEGLPDFVKCVGFRVAWWEVKLLREGTKMPVKTSWPDDAGWDLFYCPEEGRTEPELVEVCGSFYLKLTTGLAMAFPSDWAFLVSVGRSGLAKEHMWDPLAGLIDSGYRGEVVVMMKTPAKLVSRGNKLVLGASWAEDTALNIPHMPKPGDKIAQGIFIPNPIARPEQVDTLAPSERMEKGFGSSDEKKAA